MSQHAEGDSEDGNGHTDGTADVLVGHRPNRMANWQSLKHFQCSQINLSCINAMLHSKLFSVVLNMKLRAK